MKKLFSIMLSVIILVGVVFCTNVSVSAATQTVAFETIYSHTYIDKNCNNTVTLHSDGVVYFEMTLPKDKYGNTCKPKRIITSGSTTVCTKTVYYGKLYVFLDKGTYNFNIRMDNYTPVEGIQYCFQYRKNSNDKVENIVFGTQYLHYYNTDNCYGYFELTQNSTVRFDLAKPVKVDGTECNTYLYIYDMSANGKQIFSEFYAYTETYDNYYYSVRLPKGKYKFNFYCSAAYSYDGGYTVERSDAVYSYFKVTAAKASKPKAPKLTHKVKTTKYSYFTTYNIDASFADNQAYDGVELWTKENDGKWKLKDSAVNTKYSRYTQVSLYVTSQSDYVVFYKVRTYSLYGTTKVYSDYSNILYTVTSLKPKKPAISVKSTKKKTAKISWKKVSDADGYVVYRSTKKKGGYKKVATVKKSSTVSYTNKKLSSKKTYYYKVRSYKKINGVTIYSSYSSPKKVKVK